MQCPAAPAPAGTGAITITFANLNTSPHMDAAHTWVTFGGASTGMIGTIIGAPPSASTLVLGKSYRMSTLTQGVSLTNFNSGRVYISYGAGLTANASNCWSPNFANATLADYGTRWDKVELTWNGVAGGANLTSQDFLGIPLQITTCGGGQPATTLTWWTDTATAMNALGAMCGYSLNTSGNPQGALVTGPHGVALAGLPGQTVIRVINPATVTPGTGGSTGFPSFVPYINALANAGGTPVQTAISGNNGVYGSGVQTYSFATYVVNTVTNLYGTVVRPGDLVFDGVAYNGSRSVGTTFVIRRANLTDSAIYGATAPYTMLRGSNVNAIVEKARADFLSALNFGFAGSTVTNPMRPSQTIGVSPSWTWYGNKPNGINQAKMPIKYAFAAAQPTNAYYNPVASYLTTVTDAYGFAFNDRLQAPLASLGVGSTLKITVLTDAGGSGEQTSARGPMDLVLQHANTGDIEAWNVDDFEVTGAYEPMPSQGPTHRVAAVADWNGDGHPDIVTHITNNGKLLVNSFAHGQLYDTTQLDVLGRGPAWRLAGAGDVDGDGQCDLAWVHLQDGTVELWLMNGTARTAVLTPSGQAWRAMGTDPSGLVDWNQDGTADLAVWDTATDSIGIYRYDVGANRWVPLASADMPFEVAGPHWRPVAYQDVDADGDKDVVFQKATTGEIVVVVLDALGTVEDVVSLDTPSSPTWRVRHGRD
ncbi:MAG: VCBS repeat-containing protein [Phycisphaerae bacterium]|nr:VCBS repeat-containing protein [Phycisphaerae bacterium]